MKAQAVKGGSAAYRKMQKVASPSVKKIVSKKTASKKKGR